MAEGSQSSRVTDSVDEFYFYWFDDEKLLPIADDRYAQELQMQEVLVSSALASSLSSRPGDRTVRGISRVAMVAGETSSCSLPSGKGSFCDICVDIKPTDSMFRTGSCCHSFCSDCISRYVAAKVKENMAEVRCPAARCTVLLDPPLCRGIVPREVYERWGDALCEATVLAARRFYCPYRDCSAMMVVDEGEGAVRESECSSCRRLFCAQCRVPWHAGFECREFQQNGGSREDAMLIELAGRREWKRCAKCRFYVEKRDGCLHIKCRCGYEFCYRCGLAWGTGKHGGCQKSF